MYHHQQEDADTPTAPVANGWFRGLFRRRSVDPSLSQNHNRRIQRRHSTTCNNNTTSLQHPPVNRSRSLDLVHDTKQQEYHQQQQGGYLRPIRRPSIPWEIENTNYINSNKNKIDNLLDDSLRSNTDQSIVSEVTFMTYSDEKANIIKEEFFKRMNEHEISKKEELTMEEKKVLLQEISNNAEDILQNRIKKKKEKPKQRRISQESHIDWNTVDESGTSRKDCHDMKDEQLCVPEKKSLTESLSSIMTMKRRNSICSNDNDNDKVNETWPSIVSSPQDYPRPSGTDKKKKIGGRINEGFQEEPDEVAWQHWQKHAASHDQASPPQDRQHNDDTVSTRLNIDEMIELKLLLNTSC